MDYRIYPLLKKAYNTPPRPNGNWTYMAGFIDALFLTNLITEEEQDALYTIFVDGWSSTDAMPDLGHILYGAKNPQFKK